jgi:HEAT repeat protein
MSFIKALFGIQGEASLKEPKYLQNADSAKVSNILKLLRENWAKVNIMDLLHYSAEIVKLGEAAIGPLCQTLHSDNNWEMRAIAAKCLRDIGSKTAVPALLSALSDREDQVRQPVVGALGELADSRAEQPLVKLLKDKSEIVREEAQIALEKIRSANPA